MKSTVVASAVYAEQLICKGYGLPLWQPEPPDSGEVQIGDVGLVDDGRFVRLFNAMLDAVHPLNRWGVPEGYVPLRVHPEVLRTSPALLQPGPIFNSQSVACDVSGGVSVAIPGVGAKYNFSCSSDRAAVAMLGGPGIQHKALANLPFREYTARHHQSWVAFATSVFGLAVAPEEIILVSSSVKTCQWALAACTANAVSLSLSFEVPIADLASASFGLAAFRSSPMAVDQRSGPYHGSDPVFSSRSPPASDQCLFLTYYKCRRRIWSQRPRYTTAVGAKDAQGSSGEEWSSSAPGRARWRTFFRNRFKRSLSTQTHTAVAQDVRECPPPEEIFQDPLDAILDYILETTDCTSAVTSHDDLYALFKDEAHWPSDFREALYKLKPTMCAGKDQVGFLLLEHGVIGASPAESTSAKHTENTVDGMPRSLEPPQPRTVASGSRTSRSRHSSRRNLTRALELAREAVRIDAGRLDPEDAVATYGQAIALLSSMLEELSHAERSFLADDASEGEISRLKSIRDTYADRVNVLCTTYDIAPPDAHMASQAPAVDYLVPDPTASSPIGEDPSAAKAAVSKEAVVERTLLSADALRSSYVPSEKAREVVDPHRGTPPQEGGDSHLEHPLPGQGSSAPPPSPPAYVHEREVSRPSSPHLPVAHDKLVLGTVDILNLFPTIPNAQLRSINGNVEAVTLYAHRWGADTRTDEW